MILSMTEQARLFLISVIFGFIIGFGYDWLRIFRRIIKHFNFITQLEDIFYWIISGFLLFFVMLKENNGEIRAFLILGAFIGMLLYFLIISPLFLNISIAIVNFIKKILSLIFTIILYPFKIIVKFLRIPYLFIHNCLKNFIKNTNLLLKNNQFYAKIKKYKNKFHCFDKFNRDKKWLRVFWLHKKMSKEIFFYMLFILILCCIIFGVLYNQHRVRLTYANQIAELQEQIDQANKYTEELNAKSKYKESDEYLEEIARKQLKMVKPNEIVFIDENKK